MTDFAQTYGELRERVAQVVRRADPAALEAYAPATPEWRVRDLLAHLTGVAADVNAGNLDGVATDAWTARQVAARRDRTVPQLLDEWDTEGRKLDAAIPQFPEVAAGQLIADAATHEHDIRGGLDTPGARDSDAVTIAESWMVRMLGPRLDAADAAVRIDDGDEEITVGTGPRQLGLTTSRFELMRAMTGRRSVEQMREYKWHCDPEPELLVLSLFTPRPTPLVE
jgi:uncharacterized protein (TIGR03083 family)